MQGEVEELEELLCAKFPVDIIEPGEFGGDIVQQVVGVAGQICGKIL